ncbi:MAG TPA: diguanylate cyclase [Vicinamibacteria bacterium]|nr:diguanylate cyclase [Vicinamibacteria bacterium]
MTTRAHPVSAIPAAVQMKPNGPPLETQSALLVWTVDAKLSPSWTVRPRALHGLATKIDKLLEAGREDSPTIAAHRRALAGRAADLQLDWSGRSFHLRVEPVRGEDTEVTGALGVALEDTRRSSATRRRVQEKLLEASLRDELTKLPNRASFIERLRQASAPAGWSREGLFVLLLDLDRFRDINDSLGYPAGDRLLAEAAGRLARKLRPGDVLARFGGDEFAILLAGVKTGEDAMKVSQRLIRELQAPIELEGKTLVPQVSVGIAVGARTGQRPEQILREAERSLARSKVFGPRTAPTDAPLDARTRVLMQLEAALHRALDREEFRAQYEPMISRKGGNLLGFEVLLWKRSNGATKVTT